MKFSFKAKSLVATIVISLIVIILGILFSSTSQKRYQPFSLLASDTAVKGNFNAKVELIEFSDFECPACLASKPVIDQILEKYADKIVFGYRHFPLPQHNFAFDAALASEAAGEQDKFWEMYEYLFTNQKNLSKELIVNSAKTIGLDEEKFQQSFKSNKVSNKVLRDIMVAKKLGVRSTPTFFLNGTKLEIESFAELDKLVEEAVNKERSE